MPQTSSAKFLLEELEATTVVTGMKVRIAMRERAARIVFEFRVNLGMFSQKRGDAIFIDSE